LPHGRAFVSYWETTTSGGTDEDNSWIGDCVSELEREAPSGALYVILLALDALKTSEVLAVLAAGPMENLLCNCGPEIVGSVEEIARRSPKFRLLLSGVWGRSRMDKEVWRRSGRSNACLRPARSTISAAMRPRAGSQVSFRHPPRSRADASERRN
jgi:hypothetical protein